MSNPHYNHRASLLNGLRTGGVRSVSANVPHTAAPGATFNIPRFPPHSQNAFVEEEEDQVLELPERFYNNKNMPLTAAVDGHNPFSHQQAQFQMNAHVQPFNPAFVQSNLMSPAPFQNQTMSMQMLQLEMMRIQAQALQAQQYQADMMAQVQLQQQQVQSAARRNQFHHNHNQPPATAGPTNHVFDLRAATLSAQMRKANQAAQLGLGAPSSASDDQPVPMTAALGGRFGSRSTSLNGTNPSARYPNGDYETAPPPPTPSSTTIISGGTSLGTPTSNNIHPLSKSDAVSSWRRNNNSVLNTNRTVSSPTVTITPASDNDRVSPPPDINNNSTAHNANSKFRPKPLRFNSTVSQPLPSVTIVDTDEDDSSSSSDKSHSSPTTPHSSASSHEGIPMPLSPREEASKKLFEGLGITRPTSASPPSEQQYMQTMAATSVVNNHRMVSQPTRQPRGPPSGADELGPKNFASRIRRKAIGGLGVLMDARERREAVEAY
jgi:hypothetical protein